MRALIGCQLVLAAIVAFGPTVNNANRVAGLASLAVCLVFSAAIASIASARELKLGLFAVMVIVVAPLSLRYADPYVLRNPLAEMARPLMATDVLSRLMHPHIIGLVAGPTALFLVALASHPVHSAWLRASWVGAALIGFVEVAISDSRTGIIASAAGLIVLVGAVLVVRRSVATALAVVGCCIAALAVSSLVGDDLNFRGREGLWEIALRHVGESPVIGLGYGALSSIYRLEIPGGFPPTNAHNLVIQVVADFGGIGLIALVFATAHSVRVAISDPRVTSASFRGQCAGLVFIAVAGLSESLVDATQRFEIADLTIVSPVIFAVLAIPLRRPNNESVVVAD